MTTISLTSDFEILQDLNNKFSTILRNDDDNYENSVKDTNYILDTGLNDFWTNDSSGNLNILYMNCRSLNKNFSDISNLMSASENKITALCLTETWLNKINENIFPLDGYNFVSKCRLDKVGGGLGIYLCNHLDYSICEELTFINKSIECLFITVKRKFKSNMLLGVVYRPPNGEIKLFNNEILKLLNTIETGKYSLCCISGDYNFDLLKCDKKRLLCYIFKQSYCLFFHTMY